MRWVQLANDADRFTGSDIKPIIYRYIERLYISLTWKRSKNWAVIYCKEHTTFLFNFWEHRLLFQYFDSFSRMYIWKMRYTL